MINKLYRMINEKQIITEEMFKNKDLNKLLDLRDSSEFDDEWVRVNDDIALKVKEPNCKELIDHICEECYKKAYEISKNDEIAECISDDFELIAKAIVLQHDDNWLNKLMECYFNGVFPCGILEKSKISLTEITKKYL